MFFSPFRGRHPNTLSSRRIVPHVLLMPALRLRHAVPFLILVVHDKLPPNPRYLSFHNLPISWSAASHISARESRQ
jgi:hypothetical protein